MRLVRSVVSFVMTWKKFYGNLMEFPMTRTTGVYFLIDKSEALSVIFLQQKLIFLCLLPRKHMRTCKDNIALYKV